jgi:hypothetical protein
MKSFLLLVKLLKILRGGSCAFGWRMGGVHGGCWRADVVMLNLKLKTLWFQQYKRGRYATGSRLKNLWFQEYGRERYAINKLRWDVV